MPRLWGKMRKKEYFLNLIYAVIISIPFGAFFTYLITSYSGDAMLKAAKLIDEFHPTPDDLYHENMNYSFILSILLALVVPYRALSRYFTELTNVRIPSIAYYFIYALPPAAGNTIVIDFILCATNASKLSEAAVDFPEFRSMSFGMLLFNNFFMIIIPTFFLNLIFYILFLIIQENFLRKWIDK